MTPEDVVFSFDAFKANSAAVRLLLRARDEGREDGRARGDLHASTSPATANCRRSSASSPSCPSTGGRAQAPTARSATSRQTTLEPPLGSGPYRLKGFDAQRNATYERVKDYWGKDTAGAGRHEQFRRDPLRVLPRLDGAARGAQGRPVRFPHREQRQELGHGLRFPGRQGRPRGPRGVRRARLGPHAGVRVQPAPARSSRTRGCAAPSTSPSTSRR